MSGLKTVELFPTKDLIQEWFQIFMPPYDLFMSNQELLDQIPSSPSILVIPRDEFFNHPTYREVNLANAFTYWTINKMITHVIHAPAGWLDMIPNELRNDLLVYQAEMERGLVFSVNEKQVPPKLVPFVVETSVGKRLVLQQNGWEQLTESEKREFILTYAKEWDNWTGIASISNFPEHIKARANVFPKTGGGNCLGATLFAVTGADWMLSHWVHPQTFQQTLLHAGYNRVETTEHKRGDVFLFLDETSSIRHATYHVEQDVFFNKNGQTIFNPWKLIDYTELMKYWGSYKLEIYRYIK